MSIRETFSGPSGQQRDSLTEVLERLAVLEARVAGIARNRRATEPIPRACFSVREFCTAHGISDHMFFKLQRQGLAPRTMRVGARTLITVEAAAEWRREREAAPMPDKLASVET
jgi:hypothetical protein